MGIKINNVISFTFAVGSFLAAIGSMMYFSNYTAVTPTVGAMPGLKAFVAAVFGGIGSIPGAVIGGFIIGICESLIKGAGATTFSDAFTFALLIVVLAGFMMLFQVVMPLVRPALATVGLFIALAYWNDWYNSMLFINNENLYSLQYYLYKIVNNIEAYKTILAQNSSAVSGAIEMPSESLKMALTVIVTGPIILVYPFIQKYFVSGVTIGAVKG